MKSWQRELEVPAEIAFTVRKQTKINEDSVLFLVFIQSRTPADGTVPPEI